MEATQRIATELKLPANGIRAVIALLEGALILSRVAGDSAALDAAKVGARTLLTR